MKRLFLFLFMLGVFSTSALAQDVIPLEYGNSITSTITDSQKAFSYTFEGKAGDEIYISAFDPTSDLSLELRLLTPSGALLGTVIGDDLVLFGPVALSADGRYTVAVNASPDNPANGDFAFLVDRATTIPLEMGVAQTGILSQPGQVMFFTFPGEAGDLMAYRAEGSLVAMDFYLPDGQPFIFTGYYDGQFSPITLLPQSGTYRLVFSTSQPGGTEYSFRIDAVQPILLKPGEPYADTFIEGETPVFSFNTVTGKAWAINMTLPEGGRQMQIHRVDGRETWNTELANDYGSGPNGNVRIDPFVAPEDGNYYVIFEYDDYNLENASVVYEIALNPSTIVSLAPGRMEHGTASPDTGTSVYLYEGKAGEAITITIARTSEVGAPAINITSPQDQVVVFGGRGATRASFDVVLPLDGTYRFEIFNMDYEPTTLEFSLLLEPTK